jgi:uncharacterized RDD family membrane protein YckC
VANSIVQSEAAPAQSATIAPAPDDTSYPTKSAPLNTAVHSERAQLDTAIQIVTPENIAFEYRVAGPFRRLAAYLFDFGLRVGLCVGSFIGFSLTFGLINLTGLGFGIATIVWFVLEWFYGGLFETFWNGQTPGKRIMSLRVLSITGQPINGYQAILRNFLRSADAMPMFFYQFGLITAAANSRFQRLGDLAAGTMVVVEERSRALAVQRIVEPAALQLAAQLPVNLTIGRSLARALSAYVERRDRFTWAARCEIAWHLAEPLRQKYQLPVTTNPDVLLCALYHRAFIAEGHETESPVTRPSGTSWQSGNGSFSAPTLPATMAAAAPTAEVVG